MTDPILFNTNCKAAVKLTEHGRQILLKRHQGLQNRAPHVDFGAWDRNIDEDGWYRTELWMIMQNFGEHIGMARIMPFETQIRLYPEKT